MSRLLAELVTNYVPNDMEAKHPGISTPGHNVKQDPLLHRKRDWKPGLHHLSQAMSFDGRCGPPKRLSDAAGTKRRGFVLDRGLQEPR